MSDNTENITPKHYCKFYKGIKLDPARIAVIYDLRNPLQIMCLKKVLRSGEAHKTTIQDIDDIIIGCQRWKEMLIEDQQEQS